MDDGTAPAGFGPLVVVGVLAGVPLEQAAAARPAARTRARGLPRTGRG
jgi:hypothetical protein